MTEERLGIVQVGGYNEKVKKIEHLPDANRLSVVTATILLTYALAAFIELPSQDLQLQLPGFYIDIEINKHTALAILTAGLTATGANWLLREHPNINTTKPYQHWLLPSLTAWVIGFSLFQLPAGLSWIIFLIAGGILLMLIIAGEYITVNPDDIRQPAAAAGLTAVSFTLFLILTISLRQAGIRLYLLLPAVTIAGLLVCLRSFMFHLQGQNVIFPLIVTVFIIIQSTGVLYYWPLAPVSFGFAILGIVYSFSSFIENIIEQEPIRQAIIEPILILIIIWGIAIWII